MPLGAGQMVERRDHGRDHHVAAVVERHRQHLIGGGLSYWISTWNIWLQTLHPADLDVGAVGQAKEFRAEQLKIGDAVELGRIGDAGIAIAEADLGPQVEAHRRRNPAASSGMPARRRIVLAERRLQLLGEAARVAASAAADPTVTASLASRPTRPTPSARTEEGEPVDHAPGDQPGGGSPLALLQQLHIIVLDHRIGEELVGGRLQRGGDGLGVLALELDVRKPCPDGRFDPFNDPRSEAPPRSPAAGGRGTPDSTSGR